MIDMWFITNVDGDGKATAVRSTEKTTTARRQYNTRAWRRLFAEVKERDGGRCRDAGHQAHLDPTADLTLGHVIHEVDGGEATPENVFLQCRSCNARESAIRSARKRRAQSSPQVGGCYTNAPTLGTGVGGQKLSGGGVPIPHLGPKMPAFVSGISPDGQGKESDSG